MCTNLYQRSHVGFRYHILSYFIRGESNIRFTFGAEFSLGLEKVINALSAHMPNIKVAVH